jgi:hypothetical protein
MLAVEVMKSAWNAVMRQQTSGTGGYDFTVRHSIIAAGALPTIYRKNELCCFAPWTFEPELLSF